MKIILTEKTQQELESIYNRFANESSPDFDNWEEMTDLELLITDAELYVNGAYIENNFTNLDEWCSKTACGEYETKDGNLVKQKINKMLELNIIQIID
jgi:hypothetical protein